MNFFAVFVLPFAVCAVAFGAYFLGRALPGLWVRLRKKKKGRP